MSETTEISALPDATTTDVELPIKLDVSHLITEDDSPVDNFLSEKNQRLLTEPLYASRPAGLTAEKFIVAANVGIFYRLNEQAIVPDVFLSLDVQMPESWEAKEHRSYMIWEFGKPPEVVIEIVSKTPGKENTDKLKRYERISVDYYVIFDPYRYLNANLLTVYERRAGRLQPMNRPWFFTSVGLGIMLWNGVYEEQRGLWLRWADQEGKPIPTGAERAEQANQRAEQERQRAEEERQRAEQERQRAEEERQRAEQEATARAAAEAEIARLRAELERLQRGQA